MGLTNFLYLGKSGHVSINDAETFDSPQAQNSVLGTFFFVHGIRDIVPKK